jgi:maleylacetate reductase
MANAFTYDIRSSRIVFGQGARAQIGQELTLLGVERALVLSTPFQKQDAEKLAKEIGARCVGSFSDAAMHTPVEVTERAVAIFEALKADSVVAIGGGSTIGLGKAIAYRKGCSQIVLATTYAGSEVTPILGQTEDGLKTTIKDKNILPDIVIYDPDLTVELPIGMSVTSGLNALAHAVEAVYAKDKNPISSMQAVEGVRALYQALPLIAKDPTNIDARSDALYGAWLCGTVLGAVGMALHHKLCHTLGGAFNLPHAETHSVLLPHTVAFNAAAAKPELQRISEILGDPVGLGLWEFAKALEAPMALREFGLKESDLDRAAKLAVKNPYWNPRPIEQAAIRSLLQNAWQGAPPA